MNVSSVLSKRAQKAGHFQNPGTTGRGMGCVAAVLVLLAIFGFAHATLQAAEPIFPVSTHGFTNAAGAGGAYLPRFSTDGRHVVFMSYANNLVANDDLSSHLDLFLADLQTGGVTLVSVNTNGVGGGNADALFPSVSSNGQQVVFVSAADNLMPGDTNQAGDVFLRDLAAGTTELISITREGGFPANVFMFTTNALSGNPQTSADAEFVFFHSAATNLVYLPDTNQGSDVFVRHRRAGGTIPLSIRSNEMAMANGHSLLEDITPDGQFAVFTSTATDLAPGVSNRWVEVYIRDIFVGFTLLVSDYRPPFVMEPGGHYACRSARITPDGRYVVYQVNDVAIVRRDLRATHPTNYWRVAYVPLASPDLAISDDGRYAAFVSPTNSGPAGSATNVMCRVDFEDWVECGITLVGEQWVTNFCPRLDLVAAYASAGPWMSADGERVWFIALTNTESYAPVRMSYLGLRDFSEPDGVPHRLVHLRDADFSAFDVSADEQWAAFDGTDDELVSADLNGVSDVFAYQASDESLHLLSARREDRPDLTGSGMTILQPGALSADGGVIAFLSADTVLVPDDTNEVVDVMVRDLRDGSLHAPFDPPFEPGGLVPAAFRPTISADGSTVVYGRYGSFYTWVQSAGLFRLRLGSSQSERVDVFPCQPTQAAGRTETATVSADGRFVAFDTWTPVSSFICDAVEGNSTADIVLRDFALATNYYRIVSLNPEGTLTGSDESIHPRFSPDGQWIVFLSRARSLVTNAVPNYTHQVYARNLLTDQTRLVSYTRDRTGLSTSATNPVFSADSRCVVFQSGSDLYRHWLDRDTENDLVATNGLAPSVSSDGRWVAFTRPRPLEPGVSDVYLADADNGYAGLLSVNQAGTGPGNDSSSTPCVSPDGRFVVFASRASDLVPNDNNRATDVFLRYRTSGPTLVLSRSLTGPGTGNGPSGQPLLSADGRTVAFQSFASDLVAGDYNTKRDVFIVRLAGADGDGDGLDDQWELAYFNTLERDGSADYDGDTHTDFEEWQAGTDPTNTGSVLTVVSIRSLAAQATSLAWSAVPGRTYQVQFKDTVTDPGWTDLPDSRITATGATATAVDFNSNPPHRFYRVAVLNE